MASLFQFWPLKYQKLTYVCAVKTFGLIANDPVSELKFSKINPITPKDYIDNVWNRDRSGMKKLKPDEVFEQILKKL